VRQRVKIMSKPKTDAIGAISMRAALTALLDSAQGSRKVLRHLAAVEHGLKNKDEDGAFLSEATPDQLLTMLKQLDGLMPDRPIAGLVALRLRLSTAKNAQQRAEDIQSKGQPVSSFFVDHKLEVNELDLADFERLRMQ
jgi:hypothetical protein